MGTLANEPPDNAIITAATGLIVQGEGYATRSFNLDTYKGQDNTQFIGCK